MDGEQRRGPGRGPGFGCAAPDPVGAVTRFREWLATVDVGSVGPGAGRSGRRARAGQGRRVRGAGAATVLAVPLARRWRRRTWLVRWVPQVALARRESPSLGDRSSGQPALVREMPATLAALTAGVCSEARRARRAGDLVPVVGRPRRGRSSVGTAARPARCQAAGRAAEGRGRLDAAPWWPGWRPPRLAAGDDAAGPGRDGLPERAGTLEGRGRCARGADRARRPAPPACAP